MRPGSLTRVNSKKSFDGVSNAIRHGGSKVDFGNEVDILDKSLMLSKMGYDTHMDVNKLLD